nr:Chain B, Inheritance of peroxisomes protein 2 [Saccharomyces cerevisiae S288C]
SGSGSGSGSGSEFNHGFHLDILKGRK